MMQVEQITEQTINANFAQCLEHIHNLGSTRIVNICSDKVVELQWGHADWFGFVVMVLIGLLLLTFVAAFLRDF